MGREKLDCSARVPLTTTGLSVIDPPAGDKRGGEISCANAEPIPDIRMEGAIAAVASIEFNVFNDPASPRLEIGPAARTADSSPFLGNR